MVLDSDLVPAGSKEGWRGGRVGSTVEVVIVGEFLGFGGVGVGDWFGCGRQCL